MSDDIQTVQTYYADAMEMLWRQSQTIKRLQQENDKLRAALAAERERCYLAAVSTTCSVEETADYYSGYCDGVQDAATALKETGDE